MRNLLAEGSWLVQTNKVIHPTIGQPYELQEGDEVLPFNTEQEIHAALVRAGRRKENDLSHYFEGSKRQTVPAPPFMEPNPEPKDMSDELLMKQMRGHLQSMKELAEIALSRGIKGCIAKLEAASTVEKLKLEELMDCEIQARIERDL